MKPRGRLLRAAAAALALAATHAACRADTLLECESPLFTKLVIFHDHPASARRSRDLDRGPGLVRVRIRLSDGALATAGEAGNNNHLPDGHDGIRSVEIVAENLTFAYANRQQRVEFKVKTFKGLVVEWQLLGSTSDGLRTVTVLGPRRTLAGRGRRIEGAAACPALDIVDMPGALTWYCGLGTWKVSRLASEAVLPQLTAR